VAFRELNLLSRVGHLGHLAHLLCAPPNALHRPFRMPASLFVERHVGHAAHSAPAAEPALDLATAGVLRLVWESRFGPILIEVRDGSVYVNGQRVEPAEPQRDTLP
jgi:hypothetical protein